MKIKKTLEPHQVTVICDNREQRPVNVNPLNCRRGTLTTGDYSCVGLEHVIAIERKELGDLISCVGRERERFEKEVQRLLAYPVRALVVEAYWHNIEQGDYRAKVHPNAAIGSLIGWIAQGLPIIMAGSHERCGQYISRLIFSAARRRWYESHDFISGALIDSPEPKIHIAG